MAPPRRRNWKQHQSEEKDYISCLPDDILLVILSKLKITEGARTTVLSTRWRNVWTLPSSILTMDASNNSKFQKTVDHILHRHRGQTIDELGIKFRFGLGSKIASSWIEIALQKQVKTLKLDFGGGMCDSLGSTTFISLVTLRLEIAALTPRMMACILSNSPNLLELSIVKSGWDSYRPVRMRIKGSSLKLKHLELIDNGFNVVKICAPNLVSFKWNCGRLCTRMDLKETPQLTQLSYSEGPSVRVRYDFCKVLAQLKSLTLVLSGRLVKDVEIPHFPRLENLQQMRVSLGMDIEKGLLLFVRLFKASPRLCKLALELGTLVCSTLKHELVDGFPRHECLTEVEIDGYSGCDDELQLVLWIAQSSSLSLQKIEIHSKYVKYLRFDQSAQLFTEQEYATSVVAKLQSRLPRQGLEINYVQLCQISFLSVI